MYEYAKPGLESKRTYGEIFEDITLYDIEFYKYNENDIKIEEISGGAIDELEEVYIVDKNNYTLDDIIKNYRIRSEYFRNASEEYDAEPEWVFNNIAENNIVRDEQNRILSVTQKYWMTPDESFVLNKMVCEYGDEENPVNLKEYEDVDGELQLKNDYKNIVWAECDNQITFIDFLNYEIVEPNSQKNRVSSMKQRIASGDGFKFYESHFDYDEKNRTTEKRVKEFSEKGKELNIEISKLEYPDDFGSFKIRYFNGEDVNGDGIISEDEIKFTGLYTEMYDEQGNLVKAEEFESTDGESLVCTNGVQHDIVYDDMMRISEINYLDYISGEYVNTAKDVYEYDDTATGIASVNRDNMDLKVNGYVVTFGSTDGRYVVCNADGKLVMAGSAADGWVSLESLPNGLYIVKVNGCAVKVIR